MPRDWVWFSTPIDREDNQKLKRIKFDFEKVVGRSLSNRETIKLLVNSRGIIFINERIGKRKKQHYKIIS